MADFGDALAPWLYGVGASTLNTPGQPPPGGYGMAGILPRLLAWFPGDPCGPNQHLASLGSATGLNAPSDAISALVSVAGADVWLSLDGTAATATNGVRLPAGSVLRLTGVASLHSASFLQTAAGATVDVAYFT